MSQNDKAYLEKLRKEIELGQKVKEFMKGDMWALIDDYITQSIKGLNDISSIDVSSEKKASIEIIGRKHAQAYIDGIRYFLRGHVQQSELSEHELNKILKGSNYIYRK